MYFSREVNQDTGEIRTTNKKGKKITHCESGIRGRTMRTAHISIHAQKIGRRGAHPRRRAIKRAKKERSEAESVLAMAQPIRGVAWRGEAKSV